MTDHLFALVYTDQGPGGPCGQSVTTTSPHTKVFLFESEEQVRLWLRKLETLPPIRRRRVNWTLCYPKGHYNHTPLGSVEWPEKIIVDGNSNEA